jgi:hypothetical protein
MVVSLLPTPHTAKAGDHHYALPVVRPVPRPPVPAASDTW